MGGGCAFLDYDNDGWQDILLISNSQIALYHNEKNGRFTDVSATAGFVNLRGYWMGCAVGDIDGDGFPDILLTGYHRLALLHNVSGRWFEDWTTRSGLDSNNHEHWGLSAGFMDLDGSGNLSLVLTNYVSYGPGEPQFCEIHPGIRSGCPPTSYRPQFPELWWNKGRGKFNNISESCGMKPLHGQAMSVAFTDIDSDGRMDFYIGNDGKPAELIRNLGRMRFENIGEKSGVAYNSMGHAIAAMGADWGDYDRDGKPDLAITAFSDEPYSLWRNLGGGQFDYATDSAQLLGPTYGALGFGAKWADFDNDGWPDIAFANGHVYDNSPDLYPSTTFRQPLMLFHNVSSKTVRGFTDITPYMTPGVREPIVGRGLAAGDFDNDGRVDLLAVDFEGAPMLLHNTSSASNHWVTLDLRQETGNRFAYGAKATVYLNSGVMTQFVSPASSFLSSSDPRLHFGLGRESRIKRIELRWPDGLRQVIAECQIDRIVTVVKDKPLTAEGN